VSGVRRCERSGSGYVHADVITQWMSSSSVAVRAKGIHHARKLRLRK